ncbi:MAG TPA: phosphotransferase [Pyrinomonadaceae bacterium]|nr:phosphotransferase [Pyrinomonadaceae bacterium]
MISPPYSPQFIHDCIGTAFPNSRIADAQVLSGGLLNTNIKIEFSSHQPPVVLRLYRGDTAVCLKETAILRLVHSTAPVPEVIHVEPNGIGNSPPFCILQFVNGLTFQQLKRSKDLEAIHQAAASVGETLARICAYQFSKPGRLQVDLEKELSVEEAYDEGPDPIPRMLELFLQSENLQRRLEGSFRKKLYNFIWSWSARLRAVDNHRQLVHSDFGNRNILVDCLNGRWQVVAVLDWEFAHSGSPLLDVGHFLRYERVAARLREPYFSRAFLEFGGVLPPDWSRISQVLDLTGLVHCLTHDRLPDDVAFEILQLIKSTLETCEL